MKMIIGFLVVIVLVFILCVIWAIFEIARSLVLNTNRTIIGEYISRRGAVEEQGTWTTHYHDKEPETSVIPKIDQN